MKKNEKKRETTFDLQKVDQDIQRHLDAMARQLAPVLPREEHIQYVEKYEVRGRELQAVLDAYGATQREFAKYIQKSADCVSLMCRASYKIIKFRYAQKLETFVGTELYLTTIAKDRDKRLKTTLALMESKKKQIIGEQKK